VDLLSGISEEGLRTLPWAVALVFGLTMTVWRPHRFHWAALGSALLFVAVNVGAGIYVLYHYGDARWGGGGEPPLSAPSLSDAPVVGQFMGPLESFLSGVVGGVNDFLAFKRSLPVALEFFAAAGWALLIAVPLAMFAIAMSYAEARRRRAEFARYQLTVDRLKDEIEDIKRQLGSGAGP
jgi:hypothetical protein